MHFDKNEIVEFLRRRGEDVKAHEAGQRLPDTFDSDDEAASAVLVNLGVDPGDVASGDLGVSPRNMKGGLSDA